MKDVGRPPPPTGLKRLLFRLPMLLYRANLGVLLGRRFVLIHHVGRKSGLRRQVVVEVVDHDPTAGTVTVASGFGRRSDWYRNVVARPDVSIQLGARSLDVRAVQLAPDSAAEAMVGYARRHPRAARGLSRFMGFVVDGSMADYRAVGHELPMLRFEPRDGPGTG